MKTNQTGYTAIELLIVVWFVLTMCAAGGIVYALVHFIGKFW